MILKHKKMDGIKDTTLGRWETKTAKTDVAGHAT
jgi:hypothetical protein